VSRVCSRTVFVTTNKNCASHQNYTTGLAAWNRISEKTDGWTPTISWDGCLYWGRITDFRQSGIIEVFIRERGVSLLTVLYQHHASARRPIAGRFAPARMHRPPTGPLLRCVCARRATSPGKGTAETPQTHQGSTTQITALCAATCPNLGREKNCAFFYIE